MPKYYGCPCEGCGKPLTLQDDIVVCPDCGAPYHRVCYEKLGQCIHRPAHAAGCEWKFPYEESQLRTCPSCGERTLRNEETCRCCGAVLPPEGQEPPSSRGSGEETFDYSQMYRQFGTSADPEKAFFEDAFGKEAKMDGIARQDWLDYIGPAAPAYLAAYSRMQLQKSKVSMSFSALLFGPFYFFYRKAWKPAFGFLAAELLLAAPTFIEMLQLSGSALAPATEHFSSDGICPGLLGPQLRADAGARYVRQVALPQKRRRPHPPHPVRVPRRPAASGRAPRPGRRQPWGRAAVYAAADGGGQRLYPAAGPRSAGSAYCSCRLRHPQPRL